MRKRAFVAILTVLCVLSGAAVAGEPKQALFTWEALPPIPDALGVAGPFAGVSNGALIVAGGANFPGGLWKDGAKNPDAKKVWWAKVYVLTDPKGEWHEADPLPKALGYGASVTHPDLGVICIGGGNVDEHSADVFALTWSGGKVARRELPALPEPCAFTSAVLSGEVIYVAGGTTAPDAKRPLTNFWALDLSKPAAERTWQALPAWGDSPRILSVMAELEGKIYVISGRDVIKKDDGTTTLDFLKDAYCYTPGGDGTPGGWKRIADLPRSVCAAPTPGVAVGTSHIAVFGGADGTLVPRTGELAEKHPGFSRDVLSYHSITDTWVKIGELPAQEVAGHPKGGPVTTTVVKWNDAIVIPTGEVSPGIRTRGVWRGTVNALKGGFGWLDYTVIVVYLASLIAMGVYFSRREKSTNDFFLGGRRIPWWAAGLSIYGTQLSAITFLAIPAKTFATDWVYIVGNMMIFAVAPFVVWLYLPFFRRLEITTAYEYLEKRFNLAARLCGSAAFILFQLGRMGIVLYLPALALATVTGINIYTCILAMGVLATIYTVLGGIEAVIWTDVLQVVVLLGGAILSLILIALGTEGGFGGMVSMGAEAGKFRWANLDWDIATTALWVVIIGNFLGNLVPYTSDQAVVQRYLTTKDEKSAAKAIWLNAILCVPGSVLFFLVGTALWAFYKTNPELLNPGGRANDIFAWFIAQQLPAGIAGLVIAGIFAASMSSLDSSMNSMATAITTDWFRRFKPGVDDRACLRLARVLTVVLGVVGTGAGLVMAQFGNKSMWDNYLAIVGLFGAGLGGLFMAGVFTRKINGTGAVVGFLASAVIVWGVKLRGGVHFMLYAGIGMLSCVIIGYIVSLILPGKANVEGLTVYTVKSAGAPEARNDD